MAGSGSPPRRWRRGDRAAGSRLGHAAGTRARCHRRRGHRRARGGRPRVHPAVPVVTVEERRAREQPYARPRHADPRDRPRLHADRSVRASRVAVRLPRQGRDPRFQRPAVHDDLPAHHHRDGQGQAAPRAGGRSGGAAGRRRKSRRDRNTLGARVLASARDDARLALPQRSARTPGARLARVRDRSADRGWSGRPHPRRVRDRHAREALTPVHDPDVLRERGTARSRSSHGRPRACCRGIRRCVLRSPTPRSP